MPPIAATRGIRTVHRSRTLADLEFTPGLETHDQEVKRHQPIVHPPAEIVRDTGVTDLYRQLVVQNDSWACGQGQLAHTSAATVAPSIATAPVSARRKLRSGPAARGHCISPLKYRAGAVSRSGGGEAEANFEPSGRARRALLGDIRASVTRPRRRSLRWL